MSKKPLEIFKAGKRTDSTGRTWNFSEADMRASVAAYDPAVFSAPFVIGHPTEDAPAYGWAEKLNLNGEIVEALPADNVEPQFAAMVNDGRFPKISASWFPPAHPANPVPGVWYLRHVGFLGAAAPAIPGLKTASFSAEQTDVVTVEFSAGDFTGAWALAKLARGLRDWFLSARGQDEADKAVPDYIVADLERQHIENLSENSPGFSAAANEQEQSEPTPKTTEEVPVVDTTQDKNKTADFADREAKLVAREQAIAAAEAKQRTEECANFAAGLVKAGKLKPADKEAMVSFLALQPDDSVVSFSAGDAEETRPSREWFQSFLQNLPEHIDFKERGAGDVVDFSASPNAIAKAANDYQAEQSKLGISVSATDAVKHVTRSKQPS